MSKLEVRNLNFSYDKIQILDNINLSVEKNEVLLITGNNGSGKTTLLKCISGVLHSEGKFFLDNVPIQKNNHLRKKISYIMSEDTLYDYLTVKENINFFKSLFEEDDEFINKTNDYIQLLQIQEYNDFLVKNLSQGTRHKVYLSIMLSKSSEVFLLDEPFTALDADSQEKIIDDLNKIFKQDDKCAIIVTHIDKFKSIATREYKMGKENM